MNRFSKLDIGTVTRLTRSGRVAEALDLLRAGLAGSPGAGTKLGATKTLTPSRVDRAVLPGLDKVGALSGLGTLAGGTLAGGALSGIGAMARSGRHTPAPPVPPGAVFDERVYASDVGRRGYKLYRPSRYAGQPVPLVIMLHGCTQSPDDFAAGTAMNDFAEEQVFLVAYPGQTEAANASRCWNWFNRGDQQRDRGEPALLAGITRQIMNDFTVDPARVFVAGLSAGGAAAAIMGSAYPDLYAAVGVHSGLACGAARDMPSAFSAMRQGAIGSPRNASQAMRTIVFHGDGDTTVNSVNGDEVLAQARPAGPLTILVEHGRSAGGTPYTRTVESTPEGSGVLEHWVVHGGGHAWSGGRAEGTYTDPKGPDASREMIRFFLTP